MAKNSRQIEEMQSVGIHDVHVHNTQGFAMQHRVRVAISKFSDVRGSFTLVCLKIEIEAAQSNIAIQLVIEELSV